MVRSMSVGKSVEEVTLALIDELNDDLDSLTLLAGEDFAQEDFEKLVEQVEELYPDLETTRNAVSSSISHRFLD